MVRDDVAVKIVSLLPSATEMVYALGLGDALAAVSSDCDFPPAAKRKPRVSVGVIEPNRQTAGEIDAVVRQRMASSEPLYRLDHDLIRRIQPDLILAQDLCRVCAVPSGHVTEALEVLGCSADVISFDPTTLEEVIAGIETLAVATGSRAKGATYAAGLRERLESVRAVTEAVAPVRMLALEWSDPPFAAGHWVPEMVRVAGGIELLGIEGAPSRTASWDEVVGAAPQVVAFMPCGYDLPSAVKELRGLYSNAAFAALPAACAGRVFAVDASSFFSRPGPRLVDGVEILAWVLHPDLFVEPPLGTARRVTRQ